MQVRIDVIYPEEVAIIAEMMNRITTIRDERARGFTRVLDQLPQIDSESQGGTVQGEVDPSLVLKNVEAPKRRGRKPKDVQKVAEEVIEQHSETLQKLADTPVVPPDEKEIKLPQLEDALRNYLVTNGFPKTKSLLSQFGISKLSEAKPEQYYGILMQLTEIKYEDRAQA